MDAEFETWQGADHALCKHRRERVPASVTDRTFHHSLMCCDRSRSRRHRWRRAVAQMMWKQSARRGVDDIAGLLSCSGQLLFFMWVTLSERKWVISRERRGWQAPALRVPTGSMPHSPVAGVILRLRFGRSALNCSAVMQRAPRVEIEYCTQCRWLLRAAWMAQELLTTFSPISASLRWFPVLGVFSRFVSAMTPSGPEPRVDGFPR